MFNLYIYYGGAYFDKPKQKYFVGSIELFEGVLAEKINMAAVRGFGYLLGCHADANYRYRIPTENGGLRLRQIDGEDDVIDMVATGKQTGKVEVYVVHDFHIRSIDPGLKNSSPV